MVAGACRPCSNIRPRAPCLPPRAPLAGPQVRSTPGAPVFHGASYTHARDGPRLTPRKKNEAGREPFRQLSAQTDKAAFVRFRDERDAGLKAPRLLFQSVQVNIAAGRLPAAHGNGIRYLRMPLNLKRPTDDVGLPVKSEAAE